MEIKVRKIGNSLGIILPKYLIDELYLKAGDKISIKCKGSGLELCPVDSEFEEWAKAYRKLNRNYKDVLKELAE